MSIDLAEIDVGSNIFEFGQTYVHNQKVRTISQPQGTGEYYGASDFNIGAAYSAILGERFSFGVTGKYIRQEIWHEVASGYAMDIGIKYNTKYDGLSLGSSILNFGVIC